MAREEERTHAWLFQQTGGSRKEGTAGWALGLVILLRTPIPVHDWGVGEGEGPHLPSLALPFQAAGMLSLCWTLTH